MPNHIFHTYEISLVDGFKALDLTKINHKMRFISEASL